MPENYSPPSSADVTDGRLVPNLPVQGTPEQILARALTNQALAQRISVIQDSPRGFTRPERDAYLEEACRRLYWRDAYENHQDSWIGGSSVAERSRTAPAPRPGTDGTTTADEPTTGTTGTDQPRPGTPATGPARPVVLLRTYGPTFDSEECDWGTYGVDWCADRAEAVKLFKSQLWKAIEEEENLDDEARIEAFAEASISQELITGTTGNRWEIIEPRS